MTSGESAGASSKKRTREEAIRLPFRAPRANSYSERWVGSAPREMLDRVLIFGRRDLEEVLTEFIDHYNHARPHQGIGSADLVSWPMCSRCLPGGLSAAIASAGSSTSTPGRPDEVTEQGLTTQLTKSAQSRS